MGRRVKERFTQREQRQRRELEKDKEKEEEILAPMPTNYVETDMTGDPVPAPPQELGSAEWEKQQAERRETDLKQPINVMSDPIAVQLAKIRFQNEVRDRYLPQEPIGFIRLLDQIRMRHGRRRL